MVGEKICVLEIKMVSGGFTKVRFDSGELKGACCLRFLSRLLACCAVVSLTSAQSLQGGSRSSHGTARS